MMNKQSESEPHVAIFWMFAGRLVIDATPLSTAEPYGDALTHPTGHIDYWTRLQQRGAVPTDVEYEEPPRGRVLCDKRDGRFHLLADKCILSSRDVVQQIMEELHLPPDRTSEGRDEHYRCSECLYPHVDVEDDF
jgi:hypothetical protein